MKTIGLIGGLSWESTAVYYKILNELANEKLGSLRSQKCILYSVDFEEIFLLQENDDWDEILDIMTKISTTLKEAGADFIVICANTTHKIAHEMESYSKIPVLKVTDVVGRAVQDRGLKKVALLGTRYTMKQDFYRHELAGHYDLDVVVPSDKEIDLIDDIIYEEMVRGIFKGTSREVIVGIVEGLIDRGVEGIIFGCTELPMLLCEHEFSVPVFDTLRLHAEAAFHMANEQNTHSQDD